LQVSFYEGKISNEKLNESFRALTDQQHLVFVMETKSERESK